MILSSFTRAYGAGYRSGRAIPNIMRVNGLGYLIEPKCPFKPHRFICLFLWHQGLYIGTMERLGG